MEDWREAIYSNPVKAGKRTYFFDVKATKGDDYFLCITESKRVVDRNGQFVYDKHKIFIYKEDFDKFVEGINASLAFIRQQKGEDYGREEYQAPPRTDVRPDEPAQDPGSVTFDDLD